jgi:uncharacterized membrane protein YczE
MTIPAIIAFLVVLIGVQRMPLPRWKLLAGLIALGMIITGIDILAVLALPNNKKLPPPIWMPLAGGILVGVGIGYFVRWFRYSLSRLAGAPAQDQKGEQAVHGNTH